MNISFYNGGHLSSKKIQEWLSQQTPNSAGRWNNLNCVDNIEKSDVIVVLGNRSSLQRARKGQKIIQVRREPDLVQSFVRGSADYYCDYGDCGYHAATWWILKPYSELLALPYPEKDKVISAITSSKWKHRNRFLKNVASCVEDIEFYGRPSLESTVGSQKYKGQLNYNWICKFRGLKKYRYSLALENSQQKNYFSEKIIDCFLSWTIPIYWGCPNISDFFPENSYFNIDLKRPEDIKEIIERPVEEKHIAALREARNLVLYKYNIWPTIERVLRGGP